MPIDGISNDMLHKKLEPRLGDALDRADRNGIRRDKLVRIMAHILKFMPTDDQFNQVMWVVHYETGSNGLYYALGKVPDQYKKEKEPKVESAAKTSKQPKGVGGDEKFEEHEGPFQEVRLRKEGVTTYAKPTAKRKIKRVRIYYASVLVFLIPAAGLVGAHLFGLI